MLTRKGWKNLYRQFTRHNADNVENRVKMWHPCVNCLNKRTFYFSKIKEHFLCDKFMKNYTT